MMGKQKWSNIITEIDEYWGQFKAGQDHYGPHSGRYSSTLNYAIDKMLQLKSKILSNPEGDDRPHKYLNTKKIGLDIDLVLADWLGAYAEKFDYRKEITAWNFEPKLGARLKELAEDNDFWLNIKPLMRPEDIPFEPHAYITARSVDQKITEKWLFEIVGYPCAPVYSVGFGESKVDVFKKSGCDLLVDDSYKNFVELNSAGCCCFLWDAPHNRRYDVGSKRIKSLKELV